jgi:hypothetical protein
VHNLWRQIELVEKELVLMQDRHAIRRSGGLGEVLQILSDEHLDTSAHCRRQDVPVLWIVGHRVDQ